jgi:site-specific DNA recombinase
MSSVPDWWPRAPDTTKQQEQNLHRESMRLRQSDERILSAYQEELISLEQLRERMPPLRQKEQAARAELQASGNGSRELSLRRLHLEVPTTRN